MTPNDRLARAQEAKRITQSPVFNEAFEQYMQEIKRLRLQLSPRDQEGAVRLIQMEQSVEKAKRVFQAFIEDGEIAAKELDEKPGLLKRFRSVV